MNARGYIFSVMAALAVLSLGSCSSEKMGGEAEPPVLKPAIPIALSATIAGPETVTAGTRADSEFVPGGASETSYDNERQDWWSYEKFGNGDRIGFFSQYGGGDDGKLPFENIPLTFEGSRETDHEGNKQAETRAVSWGIFTSDEVRMSPSLMSAQTTYTYFPYEPDVMTTGIELRRLDAKYRNRPLTPVGDDKMLDKDYNYRDILKCVDFLTIEGMDFNDLEKDGMMYGEFYHAFSELIIMRGEGFDNPKNGDFTINVYLKEPYTHLTITPEGGSGGWQCTLKLVERQEATNPAADNKVWQAWRGAQYSVTEADESSKFKGRDAWYVVLPTIGTGNQRTVVDYIELVDNDGHKQTVSSFKFSDPPRNNNGTYSKKLTAGWRYPFEISMQELVPTVNPFPIVKWEEDKDITDERPCGIHNRKEFDDWRALYAEYLGANDKEQYTEQLLAYGNQVVAEVSGKFLCWHFYLMTDLDFSQDAESGPVIPLLADVLDGESSDLSGSVFQNHTIKGLTDAFAGRLAGPEGVLMNISLQSPEINKPSETSPAGALVTAMEGGKIDNCNVINGTIITSGPVGMLVGSMSGGAINGCNMSGLLIGSATAAEATAARIVGTKTGGTVDADNNAAGVVF